MFGLESGFRTSPARGRQFPKVEICSKVCMNETYPNISERRAVFFDHSAGRVAAARGGQTRGKSAREHGREARASSRGSTGAASASRPIARSSRVTGTCLCTNCLQLSFTSRYTTCVYVPGRYSPPYPRAPQNARDKEAANLSRRRDFYTAARCECRGATSSLEITC